MKIRFLPILILIILATPLVAQAVDCGFYPPGCGLNQSECYYLCSNYSPGLVNSFRICCFIHQVGWWLQMLGWGLAIVAIVVAGIMYMTAGGNEDQLGKAKKTLINGLIGAIIIFLAGFIVDTVNEVMRMI